MNQREADLIEQMTQIGLRLAELTAENKILKSVNDRILQALPIHGVSGKQPYYQICPKCLGEGQVMNYNTGSTSSPMMRTCPTCNGAKAFLVQSVGAAGVCSGQDKTT